MLFWIIPLSLSGDEDLPQAAPSEATEISAATPSPPRSFHQTPGYRFPFLNWRYQTGAPIRTRPTVGKDGLVLFGADDGGLHALHPDGYRVWRFFAGGRVRSSPVVGTDGTVFFGADDGFVYALGPAGSLKWRVNLGARIRTRPGLGTGDELYVAAGKTLFRLNPDGAVVWRRSLGEGPLSAPTVGPNGRIFVGGFGGFLHAIPRNGELYWTRRPGYLKMSAPVVGPDGMIYFGSGRNHLFAVAPDGDLLWETGKGNHFVTEPALGPDGTVAAGSDNGYLFAALAGESKWGFLTGGAITAPPVIDSAGVVYVGSTDGLFYAVTADGKERWRFVTGGPVHAGARIGPDGTLYFGSDDGFLYAVGPPVEMAVLTGTVTDAATGGPLSDVTITLTSSGNGKGGATATDGDGVFGIALDEGLYALLAEKEGFFPVSMEGVMLPERGKRYRIALEMAPSAPLVIDAAQLPDAVLERAFAAKLPITGGRPPISLEVVSGALPKGVALDPESRELTGAPHTAGGDFEFEVMAEDADGTKAKRSFRLFVEEPIHFLTASLPDAVVGTPYSAALESRGQRTPHQYWGKEGSPLPPGLRLDSKTGELTGFPPKAGEFAFTAKVGDATGKHWAEGAFHLTVAERLRVENRYLPDAVVGRRFEVDIVVVGAQGDLQWRVSGLPDGFNVAEIKGPTSESGATIRITGTALSPLSTVVEIDVEDGRGDPSLKRFPFDVVAPLKMRARTMPTGRFGTEYRETIPVSGGVPPFTFQIDGALPKGLSLDAKRGVISGTPEEAVWTNLFVTVTDVALPEPQRLIRQNLAVRVEGPEAILGDGIN